MTRHPRTATLTRPKPACADDPEAWFSDDEAVQEECKAACAGCPLLTACRDGAVERGEEWGIWGGEYFGPTFEMAEPEVWLRPMVFAPAHGRNACYASGCRLPECRAAHTLYVAEWRLERKWTTAVEPDSCAEQLQLFEIGSVTTSERISS